VATSNEIEGLRQRLRARRDERDRLRQRWSALLEELAAQAAGCEVEVLALLEGAQGEATRLSVAHNVAARAAGMLEQALKAAEAAAPRWGNHTPEYDNEANRHYREASRRDNSR
jgi:hypothetical protein